MGAFWPWVLGVVLLFVSRRVFLVTFWPWVLGVVLFFFLGGLFWVLFLLGFLLFFREFFDYFLAPGAGRRAAFFSRRAFLVTFWPWVLGVVLLFFIGGLLAFFFSNGTS